MNNCFCEHCVDKIGFRDIEDEMTRLGYERQLDPNGPGMMWYHKETGCNTVSQQYEETPERFHRRAVRRAHAAQKE